MGEIRIIAGTHRGRTLKSFTNDLSVRPILARIKKSVFDILTPRLPDAVFLDLFSGLGTVGIEALARGAQKAVFVEGDRRCVDMINRNLTQLGLLDRSRVCQRNVVQGLSFLHESFDLIFMGPPYKDEHKAPLALTSPVIARIIEAGALKPGGIIIAQHHENETVTIPDTVYNYRNETYGDTIVS